MINQICGSSLVHSWPARWKQGYLLLTLCVSLCALQKFPVNDLSGSTIQRQRRELQLLMAELKDRDKELNAMAASHHKQLHAWEQDRQRVLSLEQRCARLDGEDTGNTKDIFLYLIQNRSSFSRKPANNAE